MGESNPVLPISEVRFSRALVTIDISTIYYKLGPIFIPNTRIVITETTNTTIALTVIGNTSLINSTLSLLAKTYSNKMKNQITPKTIKIMPEASINNGERK